MATSGGNGGKETTGRQAINININELPAVGCPNCGCEVFATNVAMYKKLSAIQVGKPMLAKIEVCICQDCGALIQPVGDELKLVTVVPKGEGSLSET